MSEPTPEAVEALRHIAWRATDRLNRAESLKVARAVLAAGYVKEEPRHLDQCCGGCETCASACPGCVEETP